MKSYYLYWLLLGLIALLFAQNILLSKKLAAVWSLVQDTEKILLEGTCD